MKNYRFFLVVLSILSLIFSCTKEESNPFIPSYSSAITIYGVDSLYVKNLTADVVYPNGVVFNCELRYNNFSYIQLLAQETIESDCYGQETWKIIDADSTKTYNIRLTAVYKAGGIDYFNTNYRIDYWKYNSEHFIIAYITIKRA